MNPHSRTWFPAAAGFRVVAMAVLLYAWVPPTGAQIKSPALPEQPTLKVPAIKPPVERTTAIVVPRENCGTWWSSWGNDRDANPCPANCERGERLALKESRDGGKVRYQVNYRCYFPELVVNQPPGAMREPGAPARTNCGTFWTARQSEPSTDANPCPANCERGELLGVKRGSSDGKSHYEMWYRCYVAQPGFPSPAIGSGIGQASRRTPKPLARNVAVPNMTLAGAGPTATVKVPQLHLVGAGPTSAVSVNAMSLVGSGPTGLVQVPVMTLTGAEQSPSALPPTGTGANQR